MNYGMHANLGMVAVEAAGVDSAAGEDSVYPSQAALGAGEEAVMEAGEEAEEAVMEAGEEAGVGVEAGAAGGAEAGEA